jgi:hypothetical protein
MLFAAAEVVGQASRVRARPILAHQFSAPHIPDTRILRPAVREETTSDDRHAPPLLALPSLRSGTTRRGPRDRAASLLVDDISSRHVRHCARSASELKVPVVQSALLYPDHTIHMFRSFLLFCEVAEYGMRQAHPFPAIHSKSNPCRDVPARTPARISRGYHKQWVTNALQCFHCASCIALHWSREPGAIEYWPGEIPLMWARIGKLYDGG